MRLDYDKIITDCYPNLNNDYGQGKIPTPRPAINTGKAKDRIKRLAPYASLLSLALAVV